MKLRWFYRCALYFTISMIIGPYYDGWSSTAKYLISEGVYSSVCKNFQQTPKLFYLKPLCDEQVYNVGRLLSFYRISEFLSSIFTGVFMDNFGPKLTIIISIMLRILTWLFIPLFPNVGGLIIFTCILCGISTNGLAFPIFTIAQYSKKYYNISMIAISVSLCFATFYTFLLNHIKYALSNYNPVKIIIVMLVLTHLPFLILSAFIFPKSLQKDVKLNLSDEHPSKNDEDLRVISDQKPYGNEKRWEFKEFLAILGRVDILIISLASMVNVISLTFAQESFPISYGDKKLAITVNEILIPLSFVFSIASTFLLERFSCVPIIIFLNLVGAIMHLSMLFTDLILSFFTSFLMSLSYSLFMTQYYLYLDKQVPLTYQGSVKGFLVTIIGFSLFINIGLNYLSKTYYYTREIHLSIMAIRWVVTVPLYLFLRRQSRNGSKSFDMA